MFILYYKIDPGNLRKKENINFKSQNYDFFCILQTCLNQTHHFVGELDVGRDDDVSIVNGEPPAPDGQPADVGDFELARKCQ